MGGLDRIPRKESVWHYCCQKWWPRSSPLSSLQREGVMTGLMQGTQPLLSQGSGTGHSKPC